MSYFKLEWVKEYLPEREIKVVFDIGTHDGADGLRFKEFFPESRVVAIEADRSLFDKIVDNKKMGGLEVLNYAICDRDGMIKFYHNNGEKRGSGSIHEPTEYCRNFEGMSFSEPYEIPSTRLDTLCRKLNIEEIDIIHMDIQGAEYEALIGLGEMRPGIIFLEVDYYWYKDAVSPSKKISEMGYRKIDVSDVTKCDELWIYNNK
jgi:FkbM family methyltransferase